MLVPLVLHQGDGRVVAVVVGINHVAIEERRHLDGRSNFHYSSLIACNCFADGGLDG